MPDTGWKAPTTNGFDIQSNNHNQWTNPTNGYSDDGSYATAVDGASRLSHSYGDFEFDIPVNYIINGIEIKTEGKISAGTGYIEFGYGYDRSAGSTTNYTPESWWSTTDSVDTHGSSTNPLGATTGADMADGNFYFRIRTPAGNTGSTYSLDYVSVKVYYSPPDAFLMWFN